LFVEVHVVRLWLTFWLCASSASIAGSLCCLCMVGPRTIRVGPCGHASLCVQCFNSVMQRDRLCPICRVRITSQQSSSAIAHEPTFVTGFMGESLPVRTGVALPPPAPAVEEGHRERCRGRKFYGCLLVVISTALAVTLSQGMSHMHESTHAHTQHIHTHTHTC